MRGVASGAACVLACAIVGVACGKDEERSPCVDGDLGCGRACGLETKPCTAGLYCSSEGLCSKECSQLPGHACQSANRCSLEGRCVDPNATTAETGGSGGTGAGATGGGAITGGGDFDACAADVFAQEEDGGPLDIFFVFDRTASMGEDCAYVNGDAPPVSSKACSATYAVSDYLIDVMPQADTRLAFQWMSLADDDCDGAPYATPLVDLTSLPLDSSHTLIQQVSDEMFQGGFGTHIEGALRGIAQYTEQNRTPGREMIGVLMTDGDPSGCEEDLTALSSIISDHLTATGIRTFIIGMEGATDANLEQLGMAGGADAHPDWCGSVAAPCHYWNVEDGSGEAIASALQAIMQQAAPIPCEYPASGFQAQSSTEINWGQVNVTLTEGTGAMTTIGQVPEESKCPSDQLAWYYDDPAAPTEIRLCSNACDLVTSAESGSEVSIVVGCGDTVIVPLL